MAQVYLGIGSNINPERNLRRGIAELRSRFGALQLSNVYQNEAQGFAGDDFLNLVAGFETVATPAEIDTEIERIHNLVGRDRGEERFSPRPLDIDLLLYDDLVQQAPGPRLPRSDILQYGFVLWPLNEIAPTLVHPLTGKTIAEHWREFDAASQPLIKVDLTL